MIIETIGFLRFPLCLFVPFEPTSSKPNYANLFPYPPTWIWEGKLTCVFHVHVNLY